MNVLLFQLAAVLAAATGPAASENTLLNKLVEKGVPMPDGQYIRLPAPVMAEGLDARQQQAVLAASAPRSTHLTREKMMEQFMANSSSAPINLKVDKIPGKIGTDLIRTVNLCFVVHGDWDLLTSDQFSKTILKSGQANNQNNQGMVVKAGYLTAPELIFRKLKTRSTPVLKEYFLYTTFNLFDQVELSATRFGMATKTPDGVIVAAEVDPRFAADKEYPNRWREIIKNALGNTVYGPPHPYSGAAFYAKVTRLIKPRGVIFVELHQVFYEPNAWFTVNVNLMPSNLHRIIPYEVKQFRMKLARAMQEQAEKKPEK